MVRTPKITPAHIRGHDNNNSTITNLRDANIHVNCYKKYYCHAKCSLHVFNTPLIVFVFSSCSRVLRLEILLFKTVGTIWQSDQFSYRGERYAHRRYSPTPSHLNPGAIPNRFGAQGPSYFGRLGPFFFFF